jgi:hypothetical protein
VELREAERLVEAAPEVGHPARVPGPLIQSTIGDGADFVAIRSAFGSIIGARLARPGRSIWCSLAAESTFGAAVSTLWSLSALQRWSDEDGPPSMSRGTAGWVAGDAALPAASEIQLVLERAREVLAAVVLSGGGQPITGIARGGLEAAECIGLLQKRAGIFGVPLFDGADDGPGVESDRRLATLGFTFRTVVTGERGLWCFGAEIGAEPAQTLWILTQRSAAQGLGWACLSALGRAISRHRLVPEARRA